MRARGYVPLAVVAVALVGVVVPVAPSQAADPVTVSSTTGSVQYAGAGTVTIGSAGTVTVVPGGITAGRGADIIVRPGAGHRFTPGLTTMLVDGSLSDLVPYPTVRLGATSLCPANKPRTATLDVRAATYAGDALTGLDATVSWSCPTNGAVGSTLLRLDSGGPISSLAFLGPLRIPGTSPNTTTAPPAGTTGATPIPVTNTGTEPVRIGDATLSDVAVGWSAVPGRGDCPEVLDRAASCQLSVAWTSSGAPLRATISVTSPDAPTITSVLATSDHVLADPVLTATPALDGTTLSWSTPVEYPSAEIFDIRRRASSADDWTVIGHSVGSTFGDVIPAGETREYSVVTRRALPPAAYHGTSNVVVGRPLSELPTIDPTQRSTVVSTDARTVWTSVEVSGADLAPGEYSVPWEAGVTFSSSLPCAYPVGTLTVRDMVLTAQRIPRRYDYTVDATCADGTRVRALQRYGIAGDAPGLGAARQDEGIVGAFPGQTSYYRVLVSNRSAEPRAVPTPTWDPHGAPASWWTWRDDCPATLPAGSTCWLYAEVTPRSSGSGAATVTLEGIGLFGRTVVPLPWSAQPDRTPPTVAGTRSSPFRNTYGLVDSVTATDRQSGVATTDLRYATVEPRTGRLSPWRYPAGYQRSPATVLGPPTELLQPGQQSCVSYRARDVAGNTSAWTPPACTSTPLSSTAYDGRWRRIGTDDLARHPEYGFFMTRAKDASVTYPAVKVRQVGVQVTTCRTCGTLAVYVGRTKVATISTRSARTRRGVWLTTPWMPLRGGTISIVSASTRKLIVDAVAYRVVR